VLFGATTREGGRLHNRAIPADEEGRAADWIDKVELIPIAERTLDLATSYTSSPTDLVLRLRERRSDRELTVGVTICYEGLFPARVGAAAEGADVLVNLSNDRWFDEPRPIEAQILALRARAIETGLTTLRVARSGPSVVIDGDGREITRIDAGGSALVELPLGRPATIGRRLGAARDLPWLALAAATGALGSALTRRTPVRRP
jgi:apolipoprotein N-acyltransferase